MTARRLVLASASAGRLDVLRRAGLSPEVMVSGVDESSSVSDPTMLTASLARKKAEAVVTRAGGAVVVACDSILELDGALFGKPASPASATDRWRAMRGRQGTIHTGHHVVDTLTSAVAAAVAATTVFFADLSDDEVSAYVGTGEPLRAAGAFTLDGLGGPFIAGVAGCPSNVIGLSLPLLRSLLAELGISIVDCWDR